MSHRITSVLPVDDLGLWLVVVCGGGVAYDAGFWSGCCPSPQPNLCFNSNPPPPPSPSLFFPLYALQPDLHPPLGPCVPGQPLQPCCRLGTVTKPQQGLWLESWQNLLAPSRPQQTTAGLKSCCCEKETEILGQSMTHKGKRGKKGELKWEEIRK